jgi:hypothetical protein
MQKLAADATAEAERKALATPSKPKEVQAARPKDPSRKKDNPYSRPYGRLTLEELERQITDTEVELAECQAGFGDAGSFKDPGRSQQLQAEYKALSEKLEALEAEYFAREQ